MWFLFVWKADQTHQEQCFSYQEKAIKFLNMKENVDFFFLVGVGWPLIKIMGHFRIKIIRIWNVFNLLWHWLLEVGMSEQSSDLKRIVRTQTYCNNIEPNKAESHITWVSQACFLRRDATLHCDNTFSTLLFAKGRSKAKADNIVTVGLGPYKDTMKPFSRIDDTIQQGWRLSGSYRIRSATLYITKGILWAGAKHQEELRVLFYLHCAAKGSIVECSWGWVMGRNELRFRYIIYYVISKQMFFSFKKQKWGQCPKTF